MCALTADVQLALADVLPAARRQGIARQLTLARMTWIAARSDTAWFFTEATNHASLALHASLGFREITRDFTYPGVAFPVGTGILSAAALTRDDG